MDEIDGAFIWGKVRNVLPDVQDDTAGAVIGGQMIERFFEKAWMSKANLAILRGPVRTGKDKHHKRVKDH